MMLKSCGLNLVMFLLLLAQAIHAEGVAHLLFQKNGAAQCYQFGFSVAWVGDVNGDGKADFITGTRAGEFSFAGSAYVYSGADGSVLYQKNGAADGDNLSTSVASAGDVNGDGRADFIVGATGADPGGRNNAGSAYVYSGSTGALLYQKDGPIPEARLGCSVASAGDVNGDEKADFIIGALLGSAYIYSGADGSLLFQKNGAPAGNALVFSVAGAGDVNGDGRADFIIGDPNSDVDGIVDVGSAFVYSGLDGSLLFQKDGAGFIDRFGYSVSGAGDVNGDGRADFIVGDPYAKPGIYDAGSAFIYSGLNGTLLFRKDGTGEADHFGFSVSGAGDVNRDGKADFIIGEPHIDLNGLPDVGSVFVYSGVDGSLILRKDGAAAHDWFGWSVALAEDVSADGLGYFVVGAPSDCPPVESGYGSAFVYSICAAAKGDMNSDGTLSPSDVVLMLNCVFLGSENCSLCFADVTCNGTLSPSDVVVELNAVFLNEPLCSL